jgi:hypothetical protein
MPTPEQWALMALQRVGMATGGSKEIDLATLGYIVTEAIREAVLEERKSHKDCVCQWELGGEG